MTVACMRVRSVSATRRGFTLVELLAVVAIIAIVAGIVIGISGYASKKADRGRALSDLERIKLGLEEFRVNKGRYFIPKSLNEIEVTDTSVNGSDGNITFWNAVTNYVVGYHAANNPGGVRNLDPWGNAYMYSNISKYAYRLYSRGPNKTDPSDDVDSSKGEY